MWTSIWTVIKPLFRNKYFISAFAFLVWITFFDDNNLIERARLTKRINAYEIQKEHYQEEIEQNTRKLQELKSSTENLEKFAREEYLMKKKNETIFIIKE